MREADNLTLTPSDLQDDVRSRASAVDEMSDGYGSSKFDFGDSFRLQLHYKDVTTFPLSPIFLYCRSFI